MRISPAYTAYRILNTSPITPPLLHTAYRIPHTTPPIILAISGGADSVFIFHILKKAGFKIILTHINHQLRGPDSQKDQMFVESLAKKYNIPIETKKIDIKKYAQKNSLNLEEAGRKIRYTFLEEIRKKHKAKYITTGHHLNDQIETVLLNLRRGTNIFGMSGIKTKNKNLWRPILNISKKQILKYLAKNQINYQTDESNLDSKFKRNNLRINTIPQIEHKIPNFPYILKQRIQLSQNILSSLKKYFTKKELTPTLLTSTNHVSIKNYQSVNNHYHNYLLAFWYQTYNNSTNRLSKKLIKEVSNLIQSKKTGKQIKFGPHLTIQICYNQILLIPSFLKEVKKIKNPIQKKDLNIKFLSKAPKKFNPNTLYLRKSAFKLSPKTTNQEYLQFIKISFPQKGDRFIPLGMNGKSQKLQDFFTNKHIPRKDRQNSKIVKYQNEIIGIFIKDKAYISNLYKI